MHQPTLVCLVLLAGSPSMVLAGKLSQTRKAVRATAPATAATPDDSPPREESKSQRTRRRRDDRPRYDDGRVAFSASWSYDQPQRRRPTCSEPACHSDSWDTASSAVAYEQSPIDWKSLGFAPFPYADPLAGGLLAGGQIGKPWLGRLQLETGSAGDRVQRSGVAFLLEQSDGLGVDFELDSFSEDLPAGGHDELHLGEVNLTYRVIETEHALVRVGGGIAWLTDAIATDTGGNFTVQADILPRKPWVLSAEADFGTLGDAQRIDLSGTVGVAWRRVELYVGYDYHRIADVQLQGPTLGVRLWW